MWDTEQSLEMSSCFRCCAEWIESLYVLYSSEGRLWLIGQSEWTSYYGNSAHTFITPLPWDSNNNMTLQLYISFRIKMNKIYISHVLLNYYLPHTVLVDHFQDKFIKEHLTQCQPFLGLSAVWSTAVDMIGNISALKCLKMTRPLVLHFLQLCRGDRVCL